MGRRRAITKRQVLNVKKYWIHTELKVKGKDEILEFKSREIRGYDPREDIQNLIASGEKIGVWVNPKNPEEYAVDVSFLKY
jgi:hypothetical protein